MSNGLDDLLESPENLKFQRTEWKVQHIAWLGMALIVILGFIGFLGVGTPAVIGRTLGVYLFVLLIFRLTGKRSLGQITTFDFVILLIIGDVVQPGLVGKDDSLATTFLIILTLFVIDIGLSEFKKRMPKKVTEYLESVPVILVHNGKPIKERMEQSEVDEDDIMTAARELQGLERMAQIKYAVLERNGKISIIPSNIK